MSYEPLDESRLKDEYGDSYLFRWLKALEKHLKHLDTDSVKREQSSFTEVLVKAILAPDPYPPPGRPLRHLVVRCFVILFTKGESRPLYDTLQMLLKFLGDFKVVDKDVQKTSCLFCVGELMETFGSNVMSLMGDIVNISMKLLRSSTSTILRFHALGALRKSLITARRAVLDSQMKDIIKQARNALLDKSLIVQQASCELLIVVYPIDDPARTTSEIESIVSICSKAMEMADETTRGEHARLVGHVLASSQQMVVVRVAAPPKKVKKEGELVDEDEDTPGTQPTVETKKIILKPEDMLGLLSSQFHKPTISRRTRVGIFAFYQALFTSLGPAFVEANYALIFGHFMTEILSPLKDSPTNTTEVALVQKLVHVVVHDLIALRMLGEQAQIDITLDLTNTYLRRWPALLPGQITPSPAVLSSTLEEVAGLLQQVGNVPTNVQDALMDPLIGLLAHPQPVVRARASWATRCLCYISPSRLPRALLNVLELVQRDVGVIATPTAPQDIRTRTIGHAYGLAAVIAVIRERPLYVSYDTCAKISDLATQLLKRAGSHDTQIAAVEIEVAWTLLAALMTLGPNFVRSQLPQLLVLWRNALPKPTSKDSDITSLRNASEWLFLLHVRETALGTILSFLTHNASALVTLDVSRRIASLLTNVLSFVNAFSSQKVDAQGGDSDASSLVTREAALRRRIFQCFSLLGFAGIADSTQSALLQSAIAQFASPTGYIGSAMQAAIASSSGDLTALSTCTDGYAYGVTSISLQDSESSGGDETNKDKRERLNRDAVENALDDLVRTPILNSLEHDHLQACVTKSSMTDLRHIESAPPATGVVDASIHLYGMLFSYQGSTACSASLQQQLDFVRSPKMEKNNGRRLAVTYNNAVALTFALREATLSGRRVAKETCGDPAIVTALSPLLLDTLADPDPVVRSLISESLGRLASCASASALSALFKDLVDRVVNNRDPHSRAGYALSFGSIFLHVGGLAGGPLLKTTVNVLMSLSQDPHPVVHFWAVHALGQVINAASLAFAPYVVSTLNMILKIYITDVHEPEGGTLHNSNIRGDLPSYQVICRIMDGIVNVLGPDLQETSSTQGLVLDLVHELFLEHDEGIRVEAIKTMQHLLMFAADQVTIPELVSTFRMFLTSHRRLLKTASIHALYQLVQRDALSMSQIGGDALVSELFGMLDSDPTITGVRRVITSWLEQTAVLNPTAWIDVCQRIMSRSVAHQTGSQQKGMATQDDEAEGLNAEDTSGGATSTGQVTARWRTQLFALECLHGICVLIAKSGRREHVDIPFARTHDIPLKALLVSRVSDLIKMAFTASASHVTEIRLEGLVLLRDVIETFARAPDPDFHEALMLEQHQAPITAALTPAFGSDSAPEILASAVEVCAVFVGSGIIKQIEKMSRILRLLGSALEQSRESGTLSLGDAGEASPNASVMLRIATLTAWAKLEIASASQAYLLAVVQPHRSVLASLWLSALRDYATIRADIEIASQDTSIAAMDSSSGGIGRDVLLPYYMDSWPVLLHAIAMLMAIKDVNIVRAMDGIESAPEPAASTTRSEPTALFFVVFGLAFEALLTSSPDTHSRSSPSTNIRIALQLLQYLVRPEYSGERFTEGPIFEEFLATAYRMVAVSESAEIQAMWIEVMANLLTSRMNMSKASQMSSEGLGAESPQTRCLQVISFITHEAVYTDRTKIGTQAHDYQGQAKVIQVAFDAFARLQQAVGGVAEDDLRSISISLYHDLLKDESLNVNAVELTLPSLKNILEAPTKKSVAYEQLLHGFISGCLGTIDEMRGREGGITLKKLKNNLLAAVLAVTTADRHIQISQVVVDRLTSVLSSHLLEDTETSLPAAQCARTMISSAIAGNRNLGSAMRSLLPAMVSYIGSAAAHDALSTQGYQIAATTEILKAFAIIVAGTPPSAHAPLFGVLLPSLTLFMVTPKDQAPSPLESIALSQVLALASSHGAPFREAIVKLEPPTREVLESSIRSALGSQSSQGGQNSAKPQISLRAF